MQPKQAEAMIAKNYLEEKELKVLNNLVAAYFDLAELNAIEEREMRMSDYIRELDNIMSYTGRKVLDGAGTISHNQAHDKAVEEYKKYNAKTLSSVENEYLNVIGNFEKIAKKIKPNWSSLPLLMMVDQLHNLFHIASIVV